MERQILNCIEKHSKISPFSVVYRDRESYSIILCLIYVLYNLFVITKRVMLRTTVIINSYKLTRIKAMLMKAKNLFLLQLRDFKKMSITICNREVKPKICSNLRKITENLTHYCSFSHRSLPTKTLLITTINR